MFNTPKVTNINRLIKPTPGLGVENGSRTKMFYLTTHSTHFIYGYMASGIC